MSSAESTGIRFTRMFGAAVMLQEEAQDLTQGFFLHLLEHKTLARADPLKGKFRSFLLGSLQNYLSTESGPRPLPETRWKGGVCGSGCARR